MSTRGDFEAEVRRLLVALDELLDLLSDPSLRRSLVSETNWSPAEMT